MVKTAPAGSPQSGQIELTYRCNYNCAHCYCKGSEDLDNELCLGEWKKVLRQIKGAGCLHLTITGGEPLVRKDFLPIYIYAKRQGFLVTVFTNGERIDRNILHYLTQYPPYSLEITLNGITEKTYESVTGTKGAFQKVMSNICELKNLKIPLIIKANCLKQNKNEIGKIKAFTDKFLGKTKGRGRFKYDPMIYPRLNGDLSPLNSRLSVEELDVFRRQDPLIWKEYKAALRQDHALKRSRKFLYHCGAWRHHFYINPFGRLKFCNFTEKFSSDLRRINFSEAFFNRFERILSQEMKTNSKCKKCRFRAKCYQCPSRAFLETKDEEAAVPYYCELAKAL